MQTGVGLTVTLRLRFGAADAGGTGDEVDAARLLSLFGDVAGELLIRLDGDHGTLRAFEVVEFVAPVRVGDYVEVTGVITKVGQTTRVIAFEARKVVETLRSPDLAPSAADALAEPLAVCRAIGTCVVPAAQQRRPRLVLPALSAPPPAHAELPEPRPVITPAPHVIVTPAGTELIVMVELDGRLEPRAAAEEAARCRDAGAAVVHLSPSARDPAALAVVVAAIRKRTDVLVQSAASARDGASPDLATLVCGSVNLGDGVAQSPRPAIRQLAGRIREAGALAALECWDVGHIDEAAALVAEGLVAAPLHFQFVVGSLGGVGAREDVLRFMASQIPTGASWAVASPEPGGDAASGRGRESAAATEMAIRLGGHVRIGSQGAIARAAEVARAVGRVLVEPDRARQLLGLRTR